MHLQNRTELCSWSFLCSTFNQRQCIKQFLVPFAYCWMSVRVQSNGLNSPELRLFLGSTVSLEALPIVTWFCILNVLAWALLTIHGTRLLNQKLELCFCWLTSRITSCDRFTKFRCHFVRHGFNQHCIPSLLIIVVKNVFKVNYLSVCQDMAILNLIAFSVGRNN